VVGRPLPSSWDLAAVVRRIAPPRSTEAVVAQALRPQCPTANKGG
jgi:hypothetical protein